MAENLWPSEFGDLKEKTPVSIMREQGQALGQRTANVVLGKVESGGMTADKFVYSFSIVCPPLGYRTELLRFYHQIALYPVIIQVPGVPKTFNASTPDEFTKNLREIFSYDTTKQLIASLIAQSKA